MFEGRRVLVILNPSSGAGEGSSFTDDLPATLARHGARDVDVRVTQGSEDAFDWAAAANDEGYDLVLAGGGDGTVTAVGHGVMRSQATLPIGIVPLGTANGLARVLGLPMEPMETLDALAAGRVVAIDAVDIPSHDTISLLFFGAGLDAEINREADAESKERLGIMAYVVAAIGRLRGAHNHDLHLVVDEREEHMRGHTVVGFNATRLKMFGLTMGPKAQPHDGYMEVAVLRNPGPWATLGQVVRLVSGSASRLELEPACKLRLDADPPLPVQVDGDVVGETPIEATVVRAALRFIADASYEGDRK
ncbi:MAG: diacylglycerol kinase family lipid kinase [Trueperaceae bacterium]